jgi:hypothetical protein
MARTVRFDGAGKTLADVRKATGLPTSEALNQGLRSLQKHLKHESAEVPFDIYKELDLGIGGYAIAPSTAIKKGVRRALKRKNRPMILVG